MKKIQLGVALPVLQKHFFLQLLLKKLKHNPYRSTNIWQVCNEEMVQFDHKKVTILTNGK